MGAVIKKMIKTFPLEQPARHCPASPGGITASLSFQGKDAPLTTFLFWNLCAVLFLIPLAKSPAIIAGIAFLAIWVLSGKAYREKNRWLNRTWTPAVLLFMLLPWAGLLWTKDLPMGLKFAEKSYYWLYAFAAVSLPLNRHHCHVLLYAFLYGLSLNAFIAALQFMGLVPMKREMATGLLSGYNPYISYSLLLVMGMLILSYLYRTSSSRTHRTLFLTGMAAYFFNLGIIHGRGGYIAFALLCPVILYNILGGKHFFKLVVLELLLVALLLSFPQVHNRFRSGLEDYAHYRHGQINTSVGLRLYMWKGAMEIMRSNPLVGVGTGGFEKALLSAAPAKDAPRLDHPHNSLLYMATSFGIIGIVSLLWLFVVFLKRGWERRGDFTGFTILSFGAVLLIGGIFDTQVLSRVTAMLFALLTGISEHDD